MKIYTTLYIVIGSVFLFNCLAQANKANVTDKIMDTTNTKMQNKITKNVKLYHVEENINMKFGGYTTTYNVSDSSLVNSYDLGPNNTRVVTPKYEKKTIEITQPEKKITEITYPKNKVIETTKPVITTDPIIKPKSTDKHNDFAYVYMIKTYQRVADKGYKSIEICSKLGNAYYYNSEMEKAAQCYSDLLTLTSDLEPEYYYRYSQSLRSIGKNDKANEMLEKFNELSEKNTR
ncbi:hypothetical protein AB3G33_12685 [Flavobacterium sp. WC2421]|jgi:tetratricopeptide (TPR) repeat protein|uniref:Tol-pal system YbgF family protein n=3 Tax=unclassified Flavobacterium TaxID=196869 RepID=A0AB39W7D7_9FLAO